MDYTVHGIVRARILEWVAISFSRRSSRSRDQTIMEKNIKNVYLCITESCCCIADWHNIVNRQYSVKIKENMMQMNLSMKQGETHRGWMGRESWNFSRCKLLHREWINGKVLLCRTILSTLR